MLSNLGLPKLGRRLFRTERRWGALLLETVFPGPTLLEHEAALLELGESLPSTVMIGLRASITFHGLVALAGHRRTLGRLTTMERLHLVEQTVSSDLYLVRQLGELLKVVGALTHRKSSLHRRP
jgi:hypothetical protein